MEPSNNSWHSLRQGVCLTKMHCKIIAKKLGISAALLLLVALGALLCVYLMKPCLRPQPMRSLSLSSNGVISKEWVEKHVNIPFGEDLMRIDLLALKKQLEAYRQIISAEISRVFPDTLHIQLQECQAAAKLFILKGNKRFVRLVATDGKIFCPVAYSRQTVNALPSLSNVSKNIIKDRAILQFQKINNVLDTIMRHHPDFYARIARISLKNFDPFLNEKWLQVDLFTRDGKQITFECDHLESQIQHLKQILQSLSNSQQSGLLHLNLSLNPPIVEFK